MARYFLMIGLIGFAALVARHIDANGQPVASSGDQQTLASACDPNYATPCVPIADDVDCAGGSGNGPAYLSGPVAIEVVGQDIYDLDRDHDGVACEPPRH